ncbi:MAG: FAD-binding protein [Xanthobacteraceae bacterium]
MGELQKPRDAADVEAAVRWALAERKALEVVGRGSKRAIGRPAQSDATLDLSGLSGITLYEPEELVLSAHAGTPIAEVEAIVASRGQELAFEPMDYGPLLGTRIGQGSIGGVLASNLSGPRRIKSGAARDHFLGFSAISGRGEIFKSGGRVVKNVTGYDLCKLLAGSWGTLAAMTDVTIKTLSKSETEATLVVQGLADNVAIKAMAAAMGSACDVSGAAHLPAKLAPHFLADFGNSRAMTVLRLEGVEPSVAHRVKALGAVVARFGAPAVIDAARSHRLWRAVRDAIPFAANGPYGARPVWRISTAPSRGAEVGSSIAAKTGGDVFYDWAGGLIWAVVAPLEDAGESVVRQTIDAVGGHATLIRAPVALRAVVPVFGPQDGALSALTGRVKESFDPNGVLNRGRMWAGV